MPFDVRRLPSPPKRILLVKLSSFGDIIHATPCVRAVRQSFPEAEIFMAVESRWRPVVKGNVHLTGLIECSSDVRLSPSHLLRIRRQLARFGPFDLALDLQGTRRSAAWVYLSGARIKAGRGQTRPGWKSAVAPDNKTHAVVICAGICRGLGIPVSSLQPEIFPDPADEETLDIVLRNSGLPPSGFVVCNPFSRWPAKDWPAAQAAEVAGRLSRQWRLPVVVSGDADQRQRGDELVRRMDGGTAVSLAGALTLGQALCLYRRASLMLSCDSGPMHAAAALGTPLVALFGPTHPEHTGPWGDGHRVLQASRAPEHHAYRNPAESRHMQALDAQEIFSAAEALLSRNRAIAGNR